jgi:hypothetical protein
VRLVGSASPVSRATRERRLLSCSSKASRYPYANHDARSRRNVAAREAKFRTRSDRRYTRCFGRPEIGSHVFRR